VQYVYDYELGEPAYGQVRKVVDALGRATEYWYYGADDANLARRGQVRRVEVPGGYWRELDYGGAGWLVRREVQTADGSEVTAYTYDAWGRLRAIDYPRSADVRMGWDGESRRVWVQDGAGRREYTYTAWGQVARQRGCCGSADGIEVVAVWAIYDEAGRKEFEREERADESEVRTIRYTYDKLGRLETIGDDRGAVVYHYEAGTGRLQREDYPNGSYVEYTYYGSDNPSQVGFVWKVEHKRAANNSLLIGYEYTYDLLGRVVQSVEYPSGDKTEYAYTPAGRLESEVREGQVWYRRYYKYNLDGSRHTVERDDMLNGEHVDVYAYDPVSGRLASVQDALTGEVNSFVWNPEGTLARWEEPNSYARVFGYDEEGRLVKIERDYGAGGVQVAYEYGYNSDGARVWKRDRRDMQNEQEYRYVCRIGCGGVPMRVYNRPMNGGSWASVEDYLRTPTVIAYTHVEGTFGHYVWLSGHWLADWTAGGGWMYYQDQFGVEVDTVYIPAALPKPGPEYLRQDDGVLSSDQCGGYLPTYALFLQTTQQNPNPPKPAPKPPKPAPKKDPFQECLDACTEMGEDLMKDCNQKYVDCLNSPLPLACFTLYMLCITNAGNALFGCIASCHAQFKKPFPTPPTQKEDEWNKSVDTGIKQYDSCDDDMRKKHPKLPKPEKPKLK
jgi:YD repeat-containing protein